MDIFETIQTKKNSIIILFLVILALCVFFWLQPSKEEKKETKTRELIEASFNKWAENFLDYELVDVTFDKKEIDNVGIYLSDYEDACETFLMLRKVRAFMDEDPWLQRIELDRDMELRSAMNDYINKNGAIEYTKALGQQDELILYKKEVMAECSEETKTEADSLLSDIKSKLLSLSKGDGYFVTASMVLIDPATGKNVNRDVYFITLKDEIGLVRVSEEKTNILNTIDILY